MHAALNDFLSAFANLDWARFRASFADDVTVFFLRIVRLGETTVLVTFELRNTERTDRRTIILERRKGPMADHPSSRVERSDLVTVDFTLSRVV